MSDFEDRPHRAAYADPTAHKALRDIDKADKRAKALLAAIRTIVNQSGYELSAPVIIRSTRTGREWRGQ